MAVVRRSARPTLRIQRQRRRQYIRVATRSQTIAVNQALETDLAQAVRAQKQRILTQPLETDTAQIVRPQKQRILSQPLETDTAGAITHYKVVRLGQPLETDTAQALRIGPMRVGMVTEVDTAFAIFANKARVIALGQTNEIDITFTICPSGGRNRRPLCLTSPANSSKTLTLTPNVATTLTPFHE